MNHLGSLEQYRCTGINNHYVYQNIPSYSTILIISFIAKISKTKKATISTFDILVWNIVVEYVLHNFLEVHCVAKSVYDAATHVISQEFILLRIVYSLS